MAIDEAGREVWDRLDTGIQERIYKELQEHSDRLAKGERGTDYLFALLGVVRLAINEPEKGFVYPGEDPDFEKGFKNEEVASNVEWGRDKDGRYRKVNKEWDKLLSNWQRFSEGFNKHLTDAGSPWHVEPGHTQGTGGAPSKFFLRWVNPDHQTESEGASPKHLEKYDIAYYPDEIEEGRGIKKALFNYGIARRSRIHLFAVMAVLAPVIAIPLLASLSFAIKPTLFALVTAFLLFAAFIKFIRWFTRYAQETVMPAPEWMQEGAYSDLMLEWRNEHVSRVGPRARAKERLVLARYSGQCPRCNGTVRLMDGGKDFPRRVVGRCENAMSEHVYSFDPTTMTGEALR